MPSSIKKYKQFEKFHFEEIINAKSNCDRLSGKW